MTQKEIVELILASKKLSPRKLGLRFDRVAMDLLFEIQKKSEKCVPKDKTLLFAITAPIKLPSQTTIAINKKIENHFSRNTLRNSFKFEVHTNFVQIRVTEKIKNYGTIGFVHNVTTNANELFDLIEVGRT